jgi:hypothetical protein
MELIQHQPQQANQSFHSQPFHLHQQVIQLIHFTSIYSIDSFRFSMSVDQYSVQATSSLYDPNAWAQYYASLGPYANPYAPISPAVQAPVNTGPTTLIVSNLNSAVSKPNLLVLFSDSDELKLIVF